MTDTVVIWIALAFAGILTSYLGMSVINPKAFGISYLKEIFVPNSETAEQKRLSSYGLYYDPFPVVTPGAPIPKLSL